LRHDSANRGGVIHRDHDSKERPAVHVLEWEIDPMRPRIDRHRMGVRSANVSGWMCPVVVHYKCADHAGLRGDIQPAPCGVPRKHVGSVAHRVRGTHPHGAQIDDQQVRVALAGDKRESTDLVEREAMRVVGPGQVVAGDDALGRRVDAMS
jgi:hypothetical protein